MSRRCMKKLRLFCQKVIKEKIFAIKQGPYGFPLMITEAVYSEKIAKCPFRSKCHESCYVLFLPNSTLCKTQHDWLTASQHPLRFQSLMNISTLPNALVTIGTSCDWLIVTFHHYVKSVRTRPVCLQGLCHRVLSPGWRGWVYYNTLQMTKIIELQYSSGSGFLGRIDDYLCTN